VLIILLVAVLIGLLVSNSSIRKTRKEIKDVASGVSVLAQTSDQNAKALSMKIEKTFAELGQRVDVLPKYDDDDLYDEVQCFVETEGHLSTNTIQRTFRVGYSRAVKTIEDLENNEIIEKFEDPSLDYVSWRLVKDED